MNMDQEARIQRDYYADTAQAYEGMHDAEEHKFCLSFLLGCTDYFGWQSILDVGTGTGRNLNRMAERRPNLILKGVEPADGLREQGYRSGIPQEMLVAGDGTALQFADGEFDVVCSFGVLHHIKQPEMAVAEMLRVAKKAVFISDSNNFGQGSFGKRAFKQAAHALGLWRAVNLISTRGKGYMISEGDGLFYSYSVFNNYKQIKSQCKSIHIFNPVNGGFNPYRTATHVGLLGVKK